jgi:beta-N-acetylhexosaminidase
MTAAIFGVAGLRLTDDERAFFRDADPLGFILFARNVDHPAQLRALTDDMRATLGRDCPVLVDQEGGRVQRLRAPHWREYLPALDQMAQARDPLRAQYLRNLLIAQELRAVGIDVNCAPLADIAEDATHPFLQNRLYGRDAATVIAAARACADGLLAGGVLPVLKHIPGHGRAQADSHLALPRVSAGLDDLHAHDFAPFTALADLPMGMTAHIVFDAVDPNQPATTSPAMIRLIRDQIGFAGLLISDDLSMQALSGDIASRASRAIAAGCDIALHCNGDLAEMQAVTQAAGAMTSMAETRAARALAQRGIATKIDTDSIAAEFKALVS